MYNDDFLTASDFSGIYKHIAEVIAIEATILLHNNFQGQQITLPKRLYTKEYVLKQVSSDKGQTNIKDIAFRYNYTERRLRQLWNKTQLKD